MISKISEAFVEFFGSLLGIRSVIDRPLHERRPRMSDQERVLRMDEAEDFGTPDDVSQDEINKLL